MNNIQIFQNEQFGKVRIAMNESNEPLFCLADVAKALGYSNPAKAVIDHCKGGYCFRNPHPKRHTTYKVRQRKRGL